MRPIWCFITSIGTITRPVTVHKLTRSAPLNDIVLRS